MTADLVIGAFIVFLTIAVIRLNDLFKKDFNL